MTFLPYRILRQWFLMAFFVYIKHIKIRAYFQLRLSFKEMVTGGYRNIYTYIQLPVNAIKYLHLPVMWLLSYGFKNTPTSTKCTFRLRYNFTDFS